MPTLIASTGVIPKSSSSAAKTKALFFEKLSIESLSQAIKEFERAKFDREEIISYAEKFGKKRFQEKVKKFVESKIKKDTKTP